ncbi:hypothetical protein ES288_D08G137000v1 [Gossypium darwinii]|uniref:Malic enzyme NAD-binding domain-containing protein n=1 Tax=Gossypium darwinii TaxID=34276 RepID=A0A5D2BMJ5_GOSDA|nr:hypothetical protein ES288_D08G137000v1 [Gossypium darwinii]
MLVGALGTWFPRRNTSIYTIDDDCFERCAGADTVALVARILHRSRTNLQSLLLKSNTAVVEDFFVHLGTAGVALAGLLGTVRAQGRSLDDFPNHKIVVVGAGSAGLGVLSMAVQAVVRMTGNADTAAQNFFLLDKDVQFCTSFLAFFILFVQSLLCSFRYVMSFLLCNEDVDFMN